MRRSALPHVMVWSLIVLAGSGIACRTAGLHLLGLFGVQKKPLSIATVMDQPAHAAVQAINPFNSYRALQEAMTRSLQRPVAIDVCFPFQIQMGFDTGWYHAATVTPAQYARLSDATRSRVLVVTVDREGRPARSALLVVPPDSPVKQPADLRGLTVAFGPADDSRLHIAALQLLKDAGLSRTDLALEVLPVPGSLKHLPDSRSVAQSVINGSSAAGFVDEAAWEGFAERGTKEGEPARDRLRVVARTVALPDRLWIAAPGLDGATANQLRTFLLEVGGDHPKALDPLGIAGYEVPGEELLAACRGLAGVIEPAPAEAASPESQPADEPR